MRNFYILFSKDTSKVQDWQLLSFQPFEYFLHEFQNIFETSIHGTTT